MRYWVGHIPCYDHSDSGTWYVHIIWHVLVRCLLVVEVPVYWSASSLSCFSLSSSTGSIRTYLSSQSSHLNNDSFYYLSASIFPFYHSFLEMRYFSFFFFFVGLFSICARTSMLSSSIYRKHSAAKRNQAGTNSKAITCRSERDNASKQTELARASMSSSICSSQCSQNQQRNRNLPGLQKYKHSQSLAGVTREGFATISNLNKVEPCSFSPYFLRISHMHAASGLFSLSMELLQSRQFAPKIVDLSVRSIRIFVLDSSP